MSLIAGIDRALIVRAPYAGWIVDGLKPLEMRSTGTSIRGRIGIIEARTGLIIGEAVLEDVMKLGEKEKKDFQRFHKVEDLSLLDKWTFGWFLTNPRRYKTPVKYTHPSGAVIWVKI